MTKKTDTPTPTDPRVTELEAQLAATDQRIRAVDAELATVEQARETAWQAVGAAAQVRNDALARHAETQRRHRGQVRYDEEGRETFSVSQPRTFEQERQLLGLAQEAQGDLERADNEERRCRSKHTQIDIRRSALLAQRRQLVSAQERLTSEREALVREATPEVDRRTLAGIRARVAQLTGTSAPVVDRPSHANISRPVRFERTLYRTQDGRVVPEGDPDAAILLGRAGSVTQMDAGEAEWLAGKAAGVRLVAAH